MITKRIILAAGVGLVALSAQAGNIPVIGSTEAATVSIVIPQTLGGGSGVGPNVNPASAPAVFTLLGGGPPPSITGTPAQIQALLDFANAMPPGPVRARILAALGADQDDGDS